MPFYIATIQMLVRATDEDHAFTALGELIDGHRPEAGLAATDVFMVDAAPSDLRPVASDLESQLLANRYITTSAFGDWAWHSPCWAARNPGEGWYSRDVGWTATRDLATRYDGAAHKPHDAPDDAVLVFIEY